jgi:hypothetical protein
MMTFIRKIMMAGATMLMGYAVKKLVGNLEAQAQRMQDQAEKMREQAENARDPKEFKRLKQDPQTGVYYAED